MKQVQQYKRQLRKPLKVLRGSEVRICVYRASLNDVPDLKHMLLMFNEIQMHKIGTDGKRNSPSLCFAAA
jgi:hypothetical protein